VVDRRAAARCREGKPFAVMMRDVRPARRFARVTPAEAELLASPEAPIVWSRATAVSRWRPAIDPARTRDTWGQYTPLHSSCARKEFRRHAGETSGNRRAEPQITDNAARVAGNLRGARDARLLHRIATSPRIDDRSVRVSCRSASGCSAARAGYERARIRAASPASRPRRLWLA